MVELGLTTYYRVNVGAAVVSAVIFSIVAASTKPVFLQTLDSDDKPTGELDVMTVIAYATAVGAVGAGAAGLIGNFALKNSDRVDESAHTMVAVGVVYIVAFISQKMWGRKTNIGLISMVVAVAIGILDNIVYRKYTKTRPKCDVTRTDVLEELQRVIDASAEAEQIVAQQQAELADQVERYNSRVSEVQTNVTDVLDSVTGKLGMFTGEQWKNINAMNYDTKTREIAITRTILSNENVNIMDKLQTAVAEMLPSFKKFPDTVDEKYALDFAYYVTNSQNPTGAFLDSIGSSKKEFTDILYKDKQEATEIRDLYRNYTKNNEELKRLDDKLSKWVPPPVEKSN